jgi:hypothetical protein
VQEVEDIRQNINGRFENAVQDVEDVPDDVAGWAGRDEGRYERFDNRVDNAYDRGRDEERYDDDRRNGDYLTENGADGKPLCMNLRSDSQQWGTFLNLWEVLRRREVNDSSQRSDLKV